MEPEGDGGGEVEGESGMVEGGGGGEEVEGGKELAFNRSDLFLAS